MIRIKDLVVVSHMIVLIYAGDQFFIYLGADIIFPSYIQVGSKNNIAAASECGRSQKNDIISKSFIYFLQRFLLQISQAL